MTTTLIPLNDLPQVLLERAHAEVRSYSVVLVATREADDESAAPAAGTLVVINGLHGIVTARHVWESAHRLGVLAVVIESAVLRMPVWTLSAVGPHVTGRLPDFPEAKVPDLVLIGLPSEHRATIEAKGRAFYFLARRESLGEEVLFGDDGICIAFGSPAELMKFEPGKVCAFSYATNRDRQITHGGWDYLFINLDLDTNPALPQETMQGMSGGGIWRARFARRPEGGFEFRDLIFGGVIFLETFTSPRQLVAHGPNSLYRRMPTYVPL